MFHNRFLRFDVAFSGSVDISRASKNIAQNSNSVKVTNDFLLNSLRVQFDKQQIPFDSYDDLYNSQLRPYSYIIYWLKDFTVLKNIMDQSLFKVRMRSSLIKNKYFVSFNVLINWKNVSCIFLPFNPELTKRFIENQMNRQRWKWLNQEIFFNQCWTRWLVKAFFIVF